MSQNPSSLLVGNKKFEQSTTAVSNFFSKYGAFPKSALLEQDPHPQPFFLKSKTVEGEGVKNCISPPRGYPIPTFNWVFKNQPIALGILYSQVLYEFKNYL